MARKEHRAFLALGSNLGERFDHIRFAVERLHSAEDVQVADVSPVYESEAHVLPGSAWQPPYLNLVVAVRTRLDARTLLALALRIERARGRRRTETINGTPSATDPLLRSSAWASRTLDIDLLVFDRLCLSGNGLSVPHPRLAVRRFVLRPLYDLAPDLYVPAPFNARVGELLANCPDKGQLVRLPFEVPNVMS